MRAAIAAFMLSLPIGRRWVLLPAPALIIWLTTIGDQCLSNWVTLDPGGMRLGETARDSCVDRPATAARDAGHAPLCGTPSAPSPRALTGSLAVATMTATAISLFHDLDATVMILIWNLGTAASMVAFGGLFGQRLLSWVAPRSPRTGR